MATGTNTNTPSVTTTNSGTGTRVNPPPTSTGTSARPTSDTERVKIAGAITASYNFLEARKHNLDVTGAASIEADLVSVPAPTAFLQFLNTALNPGTTLPTLTATLSPTPTPTPTPTTTPTVTTTST